MEFTVPAMKRVIKAETEKQVSRESTEELCRELEDHGESIGEVALRYAEEDGRKTVREEDIRKAVSELPY